jgi:hypothetical protein
MMDAQMNELLAQLELEIEEGWNTAHDDLMVDRLAREHPLLANELYEFFADIVAMSLEPDRERPELAAADERTRAWLKREGFRRIANAHMASKTEAPTPTPMQSAPQPKSVVAFLKDQSGQRMMGLATGLGVDAGFLTDISDHIDVVPERPRLELAGRANRAWGIKQADTLQAFATAATAPVKRAASRSTPFAAVTTTYKEMVERSKLSDEDKRYWLSLA